MRSFFFYAILTASVILIVWGAEYITILLHYPNRPAAWIGLIMMVSGTVLAGVTSYKASKGAVLVGSALLLFTGVYAWNLHYYFDPARNPLGRPPNDFYFAPGTLLILGIFFSAFFRYFYTRRTTLRAHSRPAHGLTAPTPQRSRETGSKSSQQPMHGYLTPLLRLTLLACSVALALLAADLLGVKDGGTKAQVFLGVLVFGCLSTGLISEETLTKIIPWKK